MRENHVTPLAGNLNIFGAKTFGGQFWRELPKVYRADLYTRSRAWFASIEGQGLGSRRGEYAFFYARMIFILPVSRAFQTISFDTLHAYATIIHKEKISYVPPEWFSCQNYITSV